MSSFAFWATTPTSISTAWLTTVTPSAHSVVRRRQSLREEAKFSPGSPRVPNNRVPPRMPHEFAAGSPLFIVAGAVILLDSISATDPGHTRGVLRWVLVE